MSDATTTDGESFRMTDLEERLAGPDGPALRASLMSRLAHLGQNLDAMVRTGLRSEDFARATDMKAAVDAARAMLGGQ